MIFSWKFELKVHLGINNRPRLNPD